MVKGVLNPNIVVVKFLVIWPNLLFSSYQEPATNLIVKLIELLETLLLTISILLELIMLWFPVKKRFKLLYIKSLVIWFNTSFASKDVQLAFKLEA